MYSHVNKPQVMAALRLKPTECYKPRPTPHYFETKGIASGTNSDRKPIQRPVESETGSDNYVEEFEPDPSAELELSYM
jgi:hypothetical protein